MWPWGSNKAPQTPAEDTKTRVLNGTVDVLEKTFGEERVNKSRKVVLDTKEGVETSLYKAEKSLEPIPRLTLAAGCFALGGLLATTVATKHWHRFQRIRNANWLTPDLLDGKKVVKGVVTRVGDGDNFRLYHTPLLGGHRWPLRFRSIPTTRSALAENTLHVRLAGVDAPETSHFGKPAQPFANEAMQWLKDTILGKTVYCQLVQRDQYGRVVANVYVPVWWKPFSLGRNLSIEMLKAGWATVYSQSGAEYGKVGEAEFKRQEAIAKAKRKGIWVDGELKETPAQYKKRLGSSPPDDLESVPEDSPPRKHRKRRGVLAKLFGL